MARLDMIGLIVHNLGESLRFYKALGLDVDPSHSEEMYIETTLASGLRISWNRIEMVKEIDPNYVEPLGIRMGLAFLCDSPTDVDRTFEEMVMQGFQGHREPWDAFWGQRYAQLSDPDGNVVDLFAPLENDQPT